MGQSLHIDPDRVHALITRLADVAESAQRDLTELKSTLAREGKPWGDDEPGKMVGDSYEPQAKKGLEGYHNLVENLRGLSKGIADAADAFRDQDQQGGQQIRTIGDTPIDSNRPVYSGTNPVWPSAQTQPTDSRSDTDNQTGTQNPSDGTAPSSPAESNDIPSTYPQPESAGYNPVGGPAVTQPSYPDSDTPQVRQDAPQQPEADTPTENGANTAPPSAASNSVPTAAGSTPPAATAPPSTGDSASAGKAAGTPWSRMPSLSGTPWSGARSGSRPPGQIFPPQSRRGRAANPTPSKREDKSRKKKRESLKAQHIQPPTDAAALAAIRELADRHGLQLVGFDTSGIGREMAAQLIAAVDDILGKYPIIELGGIEITELGDSRISRVARDSANGGPEAATTGQWILLDRTLVTNPARLREKVYAAVKSGDSVTGSEERPMYSTIVGDLGRIMEGHVDQRTRKLAQRCLITEYERINGPWDSDDTLARIIGGYRRWRDQLGGSSVIEGRFQPRAALVAAFAEVELRGDDACGPARVLYRLLVEGTRERSTPR
ncbi:hypothetical protein ACW2Q0_03980 [Nocardia sp. R16R-3T]